MRSSEEDNDCRTVFCGNLSPDVTDALLFELFNQAGPVESVRRPKESNGRPKSFAFILYKHECSVPYALELLRESKLFNRNLNLNSRSTLFHIPVLDTHITEYTELRDPRVDEPRDCLEKDLTSHRERDHRSKGNSRHRHSNKERDTNQPTSWAELNTLKGKGSLTNGYYREDLQGSSGYKRESLPVPPLVPDFNALLQMGQQMMLPGVMGLNGMLPVPCMMPMGLGLTSGSNMYQSMKGRLIGSELNSYNRDEGRRNHHEDRRDHEDRNSRRNHPYFDRQRNDHRDDHRRHDRGYSSSRSSHDRERRDRRSC